MIVAAILFDMDGTLFDSEALSTVATNYALERIYGRKLTDNENSQLVGLPAAVKLKEMFPDRWEEIYAIGSEYFRKITSNIEPYPGVREMLEALFHTFRLGVVTSTRRSVAQEMLHISGLSSFFGCVIGSEDTTYHKPDPEPVNMALRSLRISPGNALFVGDQPYDLIAAHSAGMKAIAATWGSGNPDILSEYRPEGVAEDPALLPAIIASYVEADP